MSSTSNTGVINHVSNPVVNFPKNSITLDIFGNAFYRRFICGAGDDVLPEHVFNADDVGYVKMDEREFNDCVEGEDYVVCKICGVRKRSLTQHLRRTHGLTREEYIKKHNGEVYSREVKRAFHNCTVSKWRTQKGRDDLKQRY